MAPPVDELTLQLLAHKRATAAPWARSFAERKRTCGACVPTSSTESRLTTSRRRCTSARRGAHRLGHAATSPDPATDIGIRDLIARLPAPRKDAFVLTQLVGLSYDEAASVCGCRVGTIRSLIDAEKDCLDGYRRHDGDRTDAGGHPRSGGRGACPPTAWITSV